MDVVKAAALCVALGAGSLLACGSSGGGGGGGGACSGATPVALTVKNYLSWCSVGVNGQAASSAAAQTVCVAAGTIPLTAVALTGFELGTAPWHHTDGDSGAGEQGTLTGSGQSTMSSASVTVSGAADCAWVCCPTAGLSDCPSTDQCP